MDSLDGFESRESAKEMHYLGATDTVGTTVILIRSHLQRIAMEALSDVWPPPPTQPYTTWVTALLIDSLYNNYQIFISNWSWQLKIAFFIKFNTMVIQTCWWFHVNNPTSTFDTVQVHDDMVIFENPLCGECRVGAGRTSLHTINLSTIAKIINFAPHQPLGRAKAGAQRT